MFDDRCSLHPSANLLPAFPPNSPCMATAPKPTHPAAKSNAEFLIVDFVVLDPWYLYLLSKCDYSGTPLRGSRE